MAYDNPYDDGPEHSGDSPPKQEMDHKEDSGDQTELLPKSFFQGKDLEIGSRCEVEIVQLHDDQVSVKYVAHDDSEKEGEGGTKEAEPASAGMASSESDMYS